MVKKISIKNFKSIREAEVKLSPINVMIGANGAGKSNFISFLKLLYVLRDDNLKNHIATNGKANSFLYKGSKHSTEIIGEITFHENTYRVTLIPDQSDNLFIDQEDSLYGNRPFHYKISGYTSHILTQSRAYRDTYLQQYFDSFSIYHFHDTGKNAPLRKPCRLKDNHILHEEGGNLPAFLYYLQEKHPANFKRIEMAVSSIAPFFKQFVLQPDRLDEEMISLEWREKDTDMYLNAYNFSDGTLRFIALATLFLQPNLPATIIIDEPELGLHPFAIYKLASLIKKVAKQSQVIISTQSVELLNHFTPEDIITVDRRDEQSVFARHTTETLEGWLENYKMGDLWTKNVIGGSI